MTVPKPLRNLDLIKVCHPAGCRSHNGCDSPGKRPVSAATRAAVGPLRDIERWMDHGGNYGVVCLDDNEIVIWDIDSAGFRDVLDETLPDTFTVESGGSGVGEHRYFRCRDFSINSSWGNPEGSVRSQNWHAVGPNSTHPETGAEYRILHDREIATVTVDDLGATMSELGDREAAGGGGPAAPPPAASRRNRTETADDLDVEPSAQTLQALGFINSDKRRQDVAKVIDHKRPSRRVRSWAAGFLYSVCGLTQNQMERLLKERADWATDNREIERQVRNMLQKVVRNRRANESVDLDRYLGPDDMTAEAVESRKTESGDTSAGSYGGDSKMSSNDFDYTSKESVTVYKADSPNDADDGDRVIKAQITNMNGRDEDGERVDTDFVTVTKGTLRDNGEFGVTPEYPQDNKSVGSAEPEDLRLIAQALNEMADQIED
jgi:hypothetical protein